MRALIFWAHSAHAYSGTVASSSSRGIRGPERGRPTYRAIRPRYKLSVSRAQAAGGHTDQMCTSASGSTVAALNSARPVPVRVQLPSRQR